MGRSAGTGSPISFLCPVERRERYYAEGRREPMPRRHTQVRTGRTRARSGRGALGQRSLHESHEYRCSCGHQGWTNHRDIMRSPLADGAQTGG